ncbi:LysE family translocator [Natronospirillum operosum]|uniref:LysE family translocator n=1 Tax=Natronospirillum operosum TaxID=2759953 RepID=A0A4Z0W7Z3_9GAMM|nr:LysE family translocator [Natronospirillum operosum]TGG91749.1 LysE family translocator [Natronospirillum operosum]
MNFETWTLFVGAVILLMSTPGPSHLLILSNSLSSGFRRSLMTAAGDLTANLIQMIVATAGLAFLIQTNEELITIIKWVGVTYLIIMGVMALLRPKPLRVQADSDAPLRSKSSLFLQGFIVSAVNPKAVIFFAALFPQFLTSSSPVLPQFAALSATYLILDGLFLTAYAFLASKLAQWLATDNAILKRAPGALLIAVALALAVRTV